MTRIVLALCFFISCFLTAETVQGKTFYRWKDANGVLQLSDQPPRGGDYQRIVVPDDNGRAGAAETDSGKMEQGEKGKEEAGEQSEIKKRQEEVVRELETLAKHYEEAGGITAGKMAALKEAAVVVKSAKMDGSEADDEFYLKIEELVRSIKNHTHIIGRVHRLLSEAKAMKGLAPPPKQEGSEEETPGGSESPAGAQ